MTVAAAAMLLVALAVASGPLDPQYQLAAVGVERQQLRWVALAAALVVLAAVVALAGVAVGGHGRSHLGDQCWHLGRPAGAEGGDLALSAV